MAKVRLGRWAAEEGDLPPVCMRCGAPTELFRDKKFSWNPPWVYVLLLGGLLPFVIVALILTRRMRVRAPLCRDHLHHWTWRTLFTLGGLAVLVALAIGTAVLIPQLERQREFRRAGELLCPAVALLGLVWLIAAAVVHSLAIHPTEITDRGITLTQVSPDFVEALYDYREDQRQEEDRRPPRRRREYDDDEDDEDWNRRE